MLSSELHQVLCKVTASQIETKDGVRRGVTSADGHCVRHTVTRVHHSVCRASRSVQDKDSRSRHAAKQRRHQGGRVRPWRLPASAHNTHLSKNTWQLPLLLSAVLHSVHDLSLTRFQAASPWETSDTVEEHTIARILFWNSADAPGKNYSVWRAHHS